MDRRSFISNFLKSFLLIATPISSKAFSLLRFNNKKYILVSMFESPPRWMFDSIIRPTKNHEFHDNEMITNEFSDLEKGVQTKLNLYEYKNYLIPSIWKSEITLSSGKTIKLSDLLDNSFLVRGVNMRQDGHPLNSMKLEAAAVGATSLGGMLAQNSNTHFPAIGISGVEAAKEKSLVNAFKTPNGDFAVSFNEVDKNKGSYIEQLFDAFGKTNPFTLKKKSVGESLSNIINKYTATNLDKEKNLLLDQKIKRIESLPIEKIKTEFETIKNKYSKIVTSSIQEKNISGVNDRYISGLKLPQTFKLKNKDEVIVDEYLGHYKLDDYYLGNVDLRDVFQKADIPTLSSQFAIAELSLKYGLTNVVLFNVDPVSNLNFKDSVYIWDVRYKINGDEITFFSQKDERYNSDGGEVLNIDGHNVGLYVGIIGYNLYFKAVAASLLEFREFLKSHSDINGNFFDQTLIHLTSEFERAPRKDYGGTDHGWRGHTSTFISGMVKNFEVVGNITARSKHVDLEKPMTWGECGDIESLERELSYNDIVTSIASVLGIDSPAQGKKVFELKDGKITAVIKDCKNLA